MPLDISPEPTEETPAAPAAPEASDDVPETGASAAPPAGETEASTEASDAAAAEAGAEKPSDEKKLDEKPAGWKAVELAKKEQLRIARQRDEVTARETKLTERGQQFEQEIARFNAHAQQFQSRAQRVEAFERAVQNGDIETLERHFGLNYQRLTERALEARDPNARVAKLERDAQDREERERTHQVSRAQVEESRSIANTLVQIVEQTADEHPDLFAWPPERVAQEGLAIRDHILSTTGRSPTYDYVMKTLQARAKAEADATSQRRTALEQRKKGGTSSAGSTGQAANRATSSSATTTPALSAKDAVVKATPPREKTEEELDEELKAQIREAFRKKK